MDDKQLINIALKAMQHSYSPYSNFTVGAALLCENGNVYTGCNIENSSFSCTVCAERNAIFKAVSEGNKDFSSIAIVGGKNKAITDFCPPCGTCRQVISEFCGKKFTIILFNGKTIKKFYLEEMLPISFGSKNL